MLDIADLIDSETYSIRTTHIIHSERILLEEILSEEVDLVA